MTSTALVDVNVVLPLLMPQHAAHSAAKAWFEGRPPGSIRYAWPTQLGVLRLLSEPRVMGPSALAPAQALEVWDRLVDVGGLEAVVAIPGSHAAHFKDAVAGRRRSASVWTDAWLAALALAMDFEMVTFDRGFRSFAGLKVGLLQA